MTAVAIMQPYFMPYLGYFRLLREVDVFVIYDCVQFPRRGWVHRNRLHDARGNLQWLTLPVQSCARDTLIRDLAFDERADEWWTEPVRRFPALRDAGAARAIAIAGDPQPGGAVSDYLVDQLERLRIFLGLRAKLQRSSELELPSTLRGQDRILEICRRFGASRYLNAPGGRALYNPESFRRAHIELNFLPVWRGSSVSVLERLAREGPLVVSAELSSHP